MAAQQETETPNFLEFAKDQFAATVADWADYKEKKAAEWADYKDQKADDWAAFKEQSASEWADLKDLFNQKMTQETEEESNSPFQWFHDMKDAAKEQAKKTAEALSDSLN